MGPGSVGGRRACIPDRGQGRRPPCPASGQPQPSRNGSTARVPDRGPWRGGRRAERPKRAEADAIDPATLDRPWRRQVDTRRQPAVRHRFDSEPGNRRNRRRRGRDRFERATGIFPAGRRNQYSGEPVPVTGFLDLRDEGYGFLRTRDSSPGPGTYTCRSARSAVSPSARATISRARPGRQGAMRIPRLAAHRHRLRPDAGRGPRPAPLREPHSVVPRPEATARGPRGQRQHDRPDRRPDRADREGSAGHDRLAAEGRQDDDPQADCPLHRGQQPRRTAHGPVGGRAPRGGDRHAAVGKGK